MNRSERAPKMEPVLRGDVAFGNSDEARKPRFRREQIVIVRVQISIRLAIADRKQLPLGVEQETKLHRIGQGFKFICEGSETSAGSLGSRNRFCERILQSRKGFIDFTLDAKIVHDLQGGFAFLRKR